MWAVINQVMEFYNHPFFNLVGGIGTTMMLIGIAYTSFCYVLGITPIIWRFGVALRDRRIAVFSSTEVYSSLKMTLVDSGIFKDRNIINIPFEHLDKAKDESIFLVDWSTYSQYIEQVFELRRNHQTAVVVYASPGSIPHDEIYSIANRSNTVVVNFRGRLLNDILTTLITTSYDRRQ